MFKTRYEVWHYASDESLKSRSFDKAVKKARSIIRKYDGPHQDDNFCSVYISGAFEEGRVATVTDEVVVVNLDISKKFPKGWTYFDEED